MVEAHRAAVVGLLVDGREDVREAADVRRVVEVAVGVLPAIGSALMASWTRSATLIVAAWRRGLALGAGAEQLGEEVPAGLGLDRAVDGDACRRPPRSSVWKAFFSVAGEDVPEVLRKITARYSLRFASLNTPADSSATLTAKLRWRPSAWMASMPAAGRAVAGVGLRQHEHVEARVRRVRGRWGIGHRVRVRAAAAWSASSRSGAGSPRGTPRDPCRCTRRRGSGPRRARLGIRTRIRSVRLLPALMRLKRSDPTWRPRSPRFSRT